jgi:hypothetical protein
VRLTGKCLLTALSYVHGDRSFQSWQAILVDERRFGIRQRTRLRAGRVADYRCRFLVECLIRDRGPRGAKIELVKDVRIPELIWLFSDDTCLFSAARVVWRNGREVGLMLRGQATLAEVCRSDLSAIARPLYGLARANGV